MDIANLPQRQIQNYSITLNEPTSMSSDVSNLDTQKNSGLPSTSGQMTDGLRPPPGFDTLLPFDRPPQHHPGNHPRSPMYRPAVLRQTNSQQKVPTLKNGKYYPSKDQGIGGELDEDSTAIVTGPPKRSHWKADEESKECDFPDCNKPFGLFERRHHCRRCGNIFCQQHSDFTVRLDQNAEFNVGGIASRTCEGCYKDYVQWHRKLTEKEEQDRRLRYLATISTNPSHPMHGHLNPTGLSSWEPKKNQDGPSVPRDWAWSTF